MSGFRQTEVYKKYGDPSTWTDEWHTMPLSDCTVKQEQMEQRARYEDSAAKALEASKEIMGSPNMAFISFHTKFPRFFSFTWIEEALTTWLRDGVFFAVMDVYEWEVYYDEYCDRREGLCDRIVPIWVSWLNCVNPGDHRHTCLVQEGLKDIFANYTDIDWFIVMEDHTFLQLDKLQSHLRPIDPSEPVVVTADNDEVVGRETTAADSQGTCRDDIENYYPMSSFVTYSRGAVAKMIPALKAGALLTQAQQSKARPQVPAGTTTTLQTVNWMFSFPALVVPFAMGKPGLMMPLQQSRRRYSWRQTDLVGIFTSGDESMDHLEAYFQSIHDENHNQTISLPYTWNNATGFRNTSTFKQHGKSRSVGRHMAQLYSGNVSDSRGRMSCVYIPSRKVTVTVVVVVVD